MPEMADRELSDPVSISKQHNLFLARMRSHRTDQKGNARTQWGTGIPLFLSRLLPVSCLSVQKIRIWPVLVICPKRTIMSMVYCI